LLFEANRINAVLLDKVSVICLEVFLFRVVFLLLSIFVSLSRIVTRVNQERLWLILVSFSSSVLVKHAFKAGEHSLLSLLRYEARVD